MFKHLSLHNESYRAHLGKAWGLAATAAWASVCLLTHGLFPPCFPQTGGDAILRAAGVVQDRRAKARLVTHENISTDNGNKRV